MRDRKRVAEAFLAIGRELNDAQRQTERLPLSRSEHARVSRMAGSAREALSEAMVSAGVYLDHLQKLRGQS